VTKIASPAKSEDQFVPKGTSPAPHCEGTPYLLVCPQPRPLHLPRAKTSSCPRALHLLPTAPPVRGQGRFTCSPLRRYTVPSRVSAAFSCVRSQGRFTCQERRPVRAQGHFTCSSLRRYTVPSECIHSQCLVALRISSWTFSMALTFSMIFASPCDTAWAWVSSRPGVTFFRIWSNRSW